MELSSESDDTESNDRLLAVQGCDSEIAQVTSKSGDPVIPGSVTHDENKTTDKISAVIDSYYKMLGVDSAKSNENNAECVSDNLETAPVESSEQITPESRNKLSTPAVPVTRKCSVVLERLKPHLVPTGNASLLTSAKGKDGAFSCNADKTAADKVIFGQDSTNKSSAIQVGDSTDNPSTLQNHSSAGLKGQQPKPPVFLGCFTLAIPQPTGTCEYVLLSFDIGTFFIYNSNPGLATNSIFFCFLFVKNH